MAARGLKFNKVAKPAPPPPVASTCDYPGCSAYAHWHLKKVGQVERVACPQHKEWLYDEKP